MLKQLATALLFAFGLAACSTDDEIAAPALRYELGELRTDSQGKPLIVKLDNSLFIETKDYPLTLHPSSLYRVLVAYDHEHQSGLSTKVYHIVTVPAPPPSASLEAQTTAPVRLLSLWRTERYINLRLGIGRSYKGEHRAGFADKGIIEHPNGRRTQVLQLFHNDGGDRSDYTQEIYLSCPTHQLRSTLRSDIDSLRFLVLTDKGLYQYNFLY